MNKYIQKNYNNVIIILTRDFSTIETPYISINYNKQPSLTIKFGFLFFTAVFAFLPGWSKNDIEEYEGF